VKRQRREITRYSGRRGGARRWILPGAAAVCLVLAAACEWVLPGVKFSAVLFSALAALCLAEEGLACWAARSRAGRVCRRIVNLCLLVGAAAFAVAEGVIVHAGTQEPSGRPAAVIVLGAGVNGSTPSAALNSRIEAAERYLGEYPDIPVVLSGGQGAGEDLSEASAMRRALSADGAETDRLILEEDSTTTEENFQNSAKLLQAQGVDLANAKVAVVTNDFHIFRAGILARQAGIDMIGVPAKLPWRWLSANYYTREFFAVGKLTLDRLAS